MRRNSFTAFDYTITLTRRGRYWVASSPEFGLQSAIDSIELQSLTPQTVGLSVLKVLLSIEEKIERMRQAGESPPPPSPIYRSGLRRRDLSLSQASQLLGLSRETLRKDVRAGSLEATRTTGGHLRIPLDSLARYFSDEVKKLAA